MEESNYLVMNNNGLVIEKTPRFPENISGSITDIYEKSKSIMENKPEDGEITVDVLFEFKNIVVVGGEKNESFIASVNNNK